ncbi:MAG TPA: L-threonylcarbamoyladenylate synthase [Spongiibacteraceae bacterium]|jgi:L-threonylcarbamoyladenylate synthase|nr:L-threonylcarbamoyladenylate synthase [Spongiibacteraceae bacterium]HUH38404.1 L-threonylcarbamoyladenylate synthase [Spongiibacteraceae bacterium]
MNSHLRVRARLAARCLAAGGVVAYPTEGVWGLGCDPFNSAAVQRLQRIKGRSPDKAFILVAAATDQLASLLAPLSQAQREQLDATWPGPLTWIIPDPTGVVPWWVKGSNETIAVRVSAHPWVAALCRAYGGPLVSTSANRSGQPPVRSRWQLQREFRGDIDHVFAGPLGGARGPSEIRDLATGRVLRARGG